MAKQEIQDPVESLDEQQQLLSANAANGGDGPDVDANVAAGDEQAIDINKIGMEDLDSISIDDDDRITRKNSTEEPGDVDGKADEAAADEAFSEKADDDAAKAGQGGKAGKDLGKEAAKEDDGAGEAETGTDAEITHDPLLDTKRALTKSQQEAAELRRRLAEYEQQKADASKPDFTEADILSTQEYKELKESDPDAALQYLEDLHAFKTWKSETEAVRQNAAQVEQQAILRQQDSEVLNFLKVEKGLDVEKNEKAVNDFYNGADYQRLVKFVTDPENGFSPDGKSGVFKASTLRNAWRLMNLDAVKSEIAKTTRLQTVEAIQKAQNGGSKLDKVPGSGGKAIPKSVANMTQDDINRLPIEQIEEMTKDY